jgi:predicted aspartyl protease
MRKWNKIIATMNLRHLKKGFRNPAVLIICSILAGCSFSFDQHSHISRHRATSEISFIPRKIHIPERRVVIPFELAKNIPLVEVYVNDQGPYLFILDTGSTGLMFSHKLAAQINATIKPVDLVLNTSSGKLELGRARHVKLVRIGGVEFHDLDAGVINLDRYSKSASIPVQGVLGMQLFANCQLTLDYLSHKIVLEAIDEVKQLCSTESNILPLKWLGYGTVAVPITINRQIFWCLIDTADGYGITLPYEKSKILPLATPVSKLPHRKVTFYRSTKMYAARLKGSLLLSCHELASPIISFQQDSKPHIGTRVLKHFIVTIDQQAMMARFMRDDSGPIEPSPPIRHHGFYFEREAGVWVVTKAIEGIDLGKLGLQVGDRVMRVNNMSTVELSKEQLQVLVDENDTLALEVNRSEKRVSVKIPITVIVP